MITTTILPETVEAVVTKCQNVVSDIIFVLDGSTSVSAENYLKAKNFIKQVIEPLSVSETSTRVAMLQYATFNNVEFLFQTDTNSTYSKIDDVQQIFGTTFTGSAIRKVLTEIVDSHGRPEANPVLVLITDGFSFDDVVSPSDSFEDIGGELFVIGVGNEFQSGSNV